MPSDSAASRVHVSQTHHLTDPILSAYPHQQVPAAAVDLESIEFENTSSIDLGSISLTPIAQFTGTARLADGTSIPVRISARTLTDDMPPMVFRGETISDANGARLL